MNHNLEKHKADLEAQLFNPWEWDKSHHTHLDGWRVNNNRGIQDGYLEEISKELGPITIPHKKR